MHNLLVQCLIARIDRDFSPEQYKELLEQADRELGYAGMAEFYTIHNALDQEYKAMNQRFTVPGKHKERINHRAIVKQAITKVPDGTPFVDQNGVTVLQGAVYTPAQYEEIAGVDFPLPEDETPQDWQPREDFTKRSTWADIGETVEKSLHAKMDFS